MESTGSIGDRGGRGWSGSGSRHAEPAKAPAGPAFRAGQSNHGARGRKNDFPDAERLVKRLVTQELTLSFVPDVAQRLWRTVTRRKYQRTCNRVALQKRRECLPEEAHIKLSSLVSDLFGPAPAGCCKRSRMANRTSRRSRRWGVAVFAPRPISCALRSVRAASFIPSLDGSWYGARRIATHRRADPATRSGTRADRRDCPSALSHDLEDSATWSGRHRTQRATRAATMIRELRGLGYRVDRVISPFSPG
jgi:hypothetical protein